MKLEITETKKTVGFGNENCERSYKEVGDFDLEIVLQNIFGVNRWDNIPEEIRKNGRDSVGKLKGRFSGCDLFSDENYIAFLNCKSKAIELTKTVTTTVTRDI